VSHLIWPSLPVDVFQRTLPQRPASPPGQTTNIARVGYGVIVRAGTPKPDVSTPECAKADAAQRAIHHLSGQESAAGAYVLSVFGRLGIGEAMKAKTKPQGPLFPRSLRQVARGEAELGIFLVSVLIAPGVELVGPFPAELQQEPRLHGGRRC